MFRVPLKKADIIFMFLNEYIKYLTFACCSRLYKLLKIIRRWHNLFNLLFIFVTASRVNNLTKTEARPCHQNRTFQLWIGLTLLFVVLALVAASLAAYFLTGKPIITFVSGLCQSF